MQRTMPHGEQPQGFADDSSPRLRHHTMTCQPESLFSWNFDVRAEGLSGVVKLNWLNSGGAISVNGSEFEVHCTSFLAGTWELRHGSHQVWATATRRGFLRPTFEIHDPSGELTFRNKSVLRRECILERGTHPVAVMMQEKMLSRLVRIEVDDQRLTTPTVLFAFWLLLRQWRQDSSG